MSTYSGSRGSTQEPCLPEHFTSISDLLERSRSVGLYNVMGVVVDFMPPKPSRGSDWQMTLRIKDSLSQSEGIRMRFFCQQFRLPNVCHLGDVVVLREVKLTEYGGETLLLSTFRTNFSVFPGPGIPTLESRHFYLEAGRTVPNHTFSDHRAPSRQEEQWAIALKHNITVCTVGSDALMKPQPPFKEEVVRQMSGSRVSTKFSLLQDVQPDAFYDLIAEVVKSHVGNFNDLTELYITDYTANEKLQDRDSISSHPDTLYQSGLPNRKDNKMTLKIEVHPPHNHWANENITKGDIIFIKNLRIKHNRSGGDLEGNLWMDKQFPSKILLYKPEMSDPRVEQLLERREKNRSIRSSKFGGAFQSSEAQNPSTKAVKRKRARKKKKNHSEQHVANDQQKISHPKSTIYANIQNHTREHEGSGSNTDCALNRYIKTDFEDIPVSSFEDVLSNRHCRSLNSTCSKVYDKPFVCCRHKLRLRVIDFYPHQLEKFCVAHKDNHSGWVWSFWLVVVPDDCASLAQLKSKRVSPMLVHCYGRDAEVLLKCEHKARDLQLAGVTQLEECLFILWGNLAEEKAKYLRSRPDTVADETFSALEHEIFPNNRPFECCIQEVGLPSKGYDTGFATSFRLFGTYVV